MNFQGFSPDSFEQFIRALALKVLGPGLSVFGNGPDGGREATFQGKINYPHPPVNIWDGYGVVQAKFKEKTEGTQKDQEWAEKQLDRELLIWETSLKRTPKPEYFIFCTNVELSSAANGGRESVEKVFKKHQKKLCLKGHCIWDANQLKAFIDGQSEIRRRFKCFFTSGDLLEELSKSLLNIPTPDAVLTAYLSRGVLADEDARLSQAGDRSEDRIKLASVFVDLHAGLTPSAEPAQEAPGDLSPASLHYLLNASSLKLDPIALNDAKSQQDSRPPLFGRFVFLGGPGSGKSTIGQFLAQIHRAAILARRPQHRLEHKVLQVIDNIKCRCEEDKERWPITPRYPFRVELNAFAKALAAGQKGGVTSLSEYLRKDLSSDVNITHQDLRVWMQSFPWLLVLDGLDEVPSSSNRREVVAAIQAFLIEARDVESDLMIVATSRPDGYGGEFDGDDVAQLHLLPLSKARALACAQKYVSAKAASKGDHRAKEAMVTLKSAIENPLVAKLMVSPLQVTFMVTVVAASGKPSESRWQLFNDYYRTIYERELHKAVRPFDKVLNERRQDIDALHHKVGFILQCRGESSGGTKADMSLEEFEMLVTACLEENGLGPDELAHQREMILGAANQRLVFLTCRTPKRISFDVRSLQEYMAAACLTNADSNVIIARLEQIAHSAYWRNTFLFSIGRFFVEPRMRDHRDKVRLLCEDLNLRDPDRSSVRLGSRLALEILESGTIGNVPLIGRSLAKCSLELLGVPSDGRNLGLLERLASIYNPALENEFQGAIKLWIGQKDFPLCVSAWLLLIILENRNVIWANQMASKEWPKSLEDAEALLARWLSYESGPIDQKISPPTVERLTRLIPQISPSEYDRLFSHIRIDTGVSQSLWFSALTSWWSADGVIEVVVNNVDKASGLKLKLNGVPLENNAELLSKVKTLTNEDPIHPLWKHLLTITEFLGEPTASNLVTALETIANTVDVSSWEDLAYLLPWPIACCLVSASSKVELLNFASEARAGKLGDFAEWIKIESGWKESGIDISALSSPIYNGSPFLIPAVSQASSSGVESNIANSASQMLLNVIKGSTDSKVRASLAWILAFYWRCQGTLQCLEPIEIQTKVLPYRKSWTSDEFYIGNEDFSTNPVAWINLFDEIGAMSNLRCSGGRWEDGESMSWLFQEFTKDRTKTGLLRLAGFWYAVHGDAYPELQNVQSIDQLQDPKLKLSIMLLCMSHSELTDDAARSLASRLPSVIGDHCEPQCLDLLLTSIERHGKKVFALDVILQKLINLIPTNEWNLLGRAYSSRNGFVQMRSSGLNQQKLEELGLPKDSSGSTS